MGEWTELERTLEGLLAADNVEVHEDGEWLPEFTGVRYELRAAGTAPLIHLWSGERNLVRRILRVAECSPGQAERRRAAAEELHHTLYRAAAERWLETKLFTGPTCLDAQLDTRHLYSQVPALSAGDRGVIDLLGVTRAGRLVVIELKASEDLQLPLQALDYWLRVRRHHAQGDFPRYGYFTGVELDPRPPLMWLVAPGLRFHAMTDVLLRYLAPEVQVTRVGLNEGWRHKVQVIFRM